MKISSSTNQGTAASQFFKSLAAQAQEGEEGSLAEALFEANLQEAEEGTANAATMVALSLGANQPAPQPVNKPVQESLREAETLAEKPMANPLADSNLRSKTLSPRERLVQAVQLQERQSASTNTVDAMTGLQPWDKHWVFQRGDTALLSPEAALAEAEQKAGIEQLLEKIQNAQTQRRGPVETASLPMQANAVAEDVLTPGSESTRAQAKEKPELSSPVGAQAPEWNELSHLFSAVQSSVGEGLDSSVDARKRKPATETKQVAQPSLRGMSSDDYLGLREAISAKPEPVTSMPIGMPSSGNSFDVPVGTWKPKSEAGRDGLFPQQEAALRASMAHAGMSAASSLNSALNSGAKGISLQPREMQGWVTQGSMAQNRLTTETLVGIGTELRSMTQVGGGEMRIRLRPDHLGELSVRVNTSGNQVALEIQASDEKAKRIIEDSVNYLKESLASQNLTVSRLDLSVAPPSAQGNANFDLSQQQYQQQGMGADLAQNQSQFGRQEGSNSERPDSQEVGLSRGAGNSNQAARFSQSGRAASNSRLDVMA
jgi:flagellar hook-length control protein FliK